MKSRIVNLIIVTVIGIVCTGCQYDKKVSVQQIETSKRYMRDKEYDKVTVYLID